MIVAYGALVPAFLLVMWAFFRFSPKRAQAGTVVAYNALSVIVAFGAGTSYAWYQYNAMSEGSDFGWWPFVASIFFLAISVVVLGFCGLLRNFIVYRKRGG